MKAGRLDLKWCVVYTRPQTERKVAANISDMGIESYLPLYKVVKQWRDRKKKMEVPLFPNYVFVKVNEIKRASLYSIKEMVKFVTIEKRPVIINEQEIVAIKRVLSGDVEIEKEEFFQEGMKVRITQGQFAGLEGVVAKTCGKTRVIIKIDGLMKAFSFSIPTHMVEADVI